MISSQTAFFPNSRHRAVVPGVARFIQVLSIFVIFGLTDRLRAQVMVTNLSESVVQAAINSASLGEEVQLPVGTAVWTNFLVITNNISLVGAGPQSTIIIDEINSTIFNNTVEGMIYWDTISNYTQCKISGCQFQDGTSQGIYHRHDRGEIMLNGYCPVCHITGCFFNNLVGAAIYFSDGTYGCVDHCQDSDTNSTFAALCYNGAICGMSPNESEYGDMSYATPVQYSSTTNWIYFEYNGFSYNAFPPAWAYDARAGTRVVFRCNSCTNVAIETHGTETSGRIRGGRAFEVYDNFFVNNAVGSTNQLQPMGFRSGTGVIYSNILVGWHQTGDGMVALTDFRASSAGAAPGWAAWGGANGLDPWDSNGGLAATGTYTGPNGQAWLTDSSANWSIGQWVGGWPGSGNTNWAYELVDVTQGGSNYYDASGKINYSIIDSNGVHDIYYTSSHFAGMILWTNGDTYEIFKSYAHLDQPGRGLCDVIADNAVGSGQPYDTVTGTTNWPNQQIEPWYQWDNTNDGVWVGFPTNIYAYNDGGYPNIMWQRDYFDNTVKPGYTPLPFPHPLDTAAGTNNPPPNGSTLTVMDGSGGGYYTNGAIVTISAYAPGTVTNAAFAYWSGSDIVNTNSASTTVTMPASNLTVTANYVPFPPSLNTAAPAP